MVLHGYQICYFRVDDEIVDNNSGVLLVWPSVDLEDENGVIYDFSYFDIPTKTPIQVQFSTKDIKKYILCEEEHVLGLQMPVVGEIKNLVMLVRATIDFDFEMLQIIGSKFPIASYSSMTSLCNKLNVQDFSSLMFPFNKLLTDIIVYRELLLKYNYPVKKEFTKLLKSSQVKMEYIITDFEETQKLQFALFLNFMCNHKCQGSGCEEYTYLKCQKCRIAHYCSKRCQVRALEEGKHQFACIGGQVSRTLDYITHRSMKEMIRLKLEKDVVTLKAAMKRLRLLIFKLNARNVALIKQASLSRRAINPHNKKYLTLLEGV